MKTIDSIEANGAKNGKSTNKANIKKRAKRTKKNDRTTNEQRFKLLELI